ncbi:MAG: EAL domain-containing protein [Microthrixaceae bacterium]
MSRSAGDHGRPLDGTLKITLRVFTMLAVPLALLLGTTISSSIEASGRAEAAASVEHELDELAKLGNLSLAVEEERFQAQVAEWLRDLDTAERSGREVVFLEAVQRDLGATQARTDAALRAIPEPPQNVTNALGNARRELKIESQDRAVRTRFDTLERAIQERFDKQSDRLAREVVALRDESTAPALATADHAREAVSDHRDLLTSLLWVMTAPDNESDLARQALTQAQGAWAGTENYLEPGEADHAPQTNAGARLDGYVDTVIRLTEGDPLAIVTDDGAVLLADDALGRQAEVESRWTTAVQSVNRLAATHRQAQEDNAGRGLLIALVAVGSSLVAATVYVVTTARSNREQRRLAGELAIQARRDALTGEANRAAAVEGLESVLADRDGLTAVAFFDLDRFKTVNDTLGHTLGDELLRQAAGRARSVAGDSAIVARFGGDEFLTVVPGLTDEAEAERFARRLLGSLQESYDIEGNRVRSTASMGLAVARRGDNAEDVLRRADLAVHAAKDERSALIVFTPEFGARFETEQDIQRDLSRELASGDGLFLHLQPVVHAEGVRIREVEALIRWEHPEHGLLPPGRFVPIAERSGLIRPMDLWVLNRALVELKRLRVATGDDSIQVSVNVSANSLVDPNFHLRALEVIDGADSAPGDVMFEVTETAVIHDLSAARDNLAQLRLQGIKIAIDDFGTGYTSIGHLRQLPVDVLKIDRSLVEDQMSGRADLVPLVVSLAEALGLTTIVEGIESDDARLAMARLGCDLVQGFGICRPQPLDKLLDRIVVSSDGVATIPAADQPIASVTPSAG